MGLISVQNQSGRPISVALVRRAVRAVLEGEGVEDIPAVVIVADEEMTRLHSQFTPHSGTTDVLAFGDEDEEGYLGDVIVNAAQAAREAAARTLTFENEFLRYVIHGTLHLCGYGDGDAAGKRQMRALERKYLCISGV